MEIWKKFNYMIKKINSELIYSKIYIIAKKHSRQEKAFNVFIEK